VGGLSHYLETEGLATTHISLVRKHTETIRPPRALWVPFELGRPLGVPDNRKFQTKVLLHALRLLEVEEGPVLEDFPEDAPEGKTEEVPLACPVDFTPQAELMSDEEKLISRFRQEVTQMQNWYALAVDKHGRTTSATIKLSPEEIVEFITDFIRKGPSVNPIPGISLSTALRMAAEDLKAYYMEAVAMQPGQPTDSRKLSEWFWSETAAAQIINRIRIVCMKTKDKSLKFLGQMLLVPRNQLHRFE
jgi:hypothetical protein